MTEQAHIDVEAELAICEVATEGPWEPRRIDYSRGLDVSFEVVKVREAPAHKVIAATHMMELKYERFVAENEANAAFIARSRTITPAALRALADAQTERDAAVADWDRATAKAGELNAELKDAQAREKVLREALAEARGWMQHWLKDVDGNLKPTRGSILQATREIDAALTAKGGGDAG